MEHGSGGGRAPWEGQQQYPPQGYGQQYPQDQAWQPPQYDLAAHQRRLRGAQQEPPGQQADYPPQDFSPRQPQPQRRRRSRWPLYAGIAALVVIAGGAAYTLAGHGSAAKPLTCKQQFAAWKTGPAHALAASFKGDGNALQSASNSEDIPQTEAALKKLGDDAAQLEQYPMPACADPASDWTQILAGIKAAGDNAGSTPGLAGLLTAMAPMQHVKALETELNAELERTVGVKSAV
jgi:hypothetical protein